MANAYLALVSPIADAGVAHFLDTAVAYTSGTLLSLRANAVEQFSVGFDGRLVWSSLELHRDADDILAQRRGTNLQASRLYGTFTDTSNYERLEFVTAAGNYEIVQASAGTGSVRNLLVGTRGLSSLYLISNNALRWILTSSGHFLANSDGNFNIGAVGANRPATIYVATEVITPSIAVNNSAEGNTAEVTVKTTRQVVAMGTGATAVSTSITIPSGARLIAVGLNVDVAVTNDGDDTWAAAFSGGSTTTIAAAGTGAAQNTKISLILNDEITSSATEITFTPQSANFTAGSIEAVVWYEEITALANA